MYVEMELPMVVVPDIALPSPYRSGSLVVVVVVLVPEVAYYWYIYAIMAEVSEVYFYSCFVAAAAALLFCTTFTKLMRRYGHGTC